MVGRSKTGDTAGAAKGIQDGRLQLVGLKIFYIHQIFCIVYGRLQLVISFSSLVGKQSCTFVSKDFLSSLVGIWNQTLLYQGSLSLI